MTNSNKAVLELEAIDSVRQELHRAELNGEDRIVLNEIYSRLMSLYASLDVHNIESVLKNKLAKSSIEHKNSA